MENNGEVRTSKFVNETVYFVFGEAVLFIFFLIPLIAFKHRYIFYLFLASYVFSIYLRLTKNDLVGFLKRMRFYASGGNRVKRQKKRY